MVKLIDSVWEYAKINPQGFPLSLKTKRAVKFGIPVGYKETQNSFWKEGLNKAIKHALDNEMIVGRWLNSKDGLFYFDSVKVFPNSKFKRSDWIRKRKWSRSNFWSNELKRNKVGPVKEGAKAPTFLI